MRRIDPHREPVDAFDRIGYLQMTIPSAPSATTDDPLGNAREPRILSH